MWGELKGRHKGVKERWLVGDTDSVCLVLAYFKNTVGTKANKHGGRAERYSKTKREQACTQK